VLRDLLAYTSPSLCVVCGREGAVVCEECDRDLVCSLEQCYGCRAPLLGSRTCDRCIASHPLSAAWVAYIYRGVVKNIVVSVKQHSLLNERRYMAKKVSDSLPYLEGYIVTFAPSTPSRRRMRGIDIAEKMARDIANSKHLEFRSLLRRETIEHQVGHSRSDRIEHMKRGFSVQPSAHIRGKSILVVDDVMTSGATLEAAARVLKKAGAVRVVAAVFARPN
jgi:predicted amidophosphoribosyltransferase